MIQVAYHQYQVLPRANFAAFLVLVSRWKVHEYYPEESAFFEKVSVPGRAWPKAVPYEHSIVQS
jgi:hypothetical protein